MTANSAGPLDGFTILDLSTVISGPFATSILAEQGARVIKVEAPGLGDTARGVGTSRNGTSAMYASVNRGKQVIALDLKQPAAADIVWHLIARADVLVQNFRPGVMERMGFGYADVAAKFPDLVYVSISGFGQSGPRATTRVYDPIIQAAAGISDSQRNPSTGAPMLYQGIMCDKVTALTAAQAITAALLARARGRAGGQHIELAMLDVAVHFHWPDGMYNHTFQEPDGVRHVPDFSAFYRLTPHADRYFAMSLTTDGEQKAFLRALELTHLLDDPRFATLSARLANQADMAAIVAETLSAMTPEVALAKMLAEDVPVALVTPRADLPDDPQIVHNATIAMLDDPATGRVHMANPPVRYSVTKSVLQTGVPTPGAHSAALLRELGFSEDKIAALFETKTVA